MSCFERIIKYDLSKVQLQVQHRMTPDIGEFVPNIFYERSLNHQVSRGGVSHANFSVSRKS